MAVSREKLIQVFCKISGYSPEQISGIGLESFTFVTDNGGKYQMSRDGKKLRKLLGPDYPKSVPQTELVEE